MDRLRGRIHAMTEISTVKGWIADSLKAAGFRGRGTVWRLKGPEVQWVVHIDELPYGNRLGVDIGLDLQLATTPRRPTDCPILLHLENVPLSEGYALVEALDLDSGLAPDLRRHELEHIARRVADYLAEHLTLSAVRAAYRAGDLGAAFIHKDARATLEAGEGQ